MTPEQEHALALQAIGELYLQRRTLEQIAHRLKAENDALKAKNDVPAPEADV